jgi:tripeptidyl-peptidase-1
VDVVGWQRGVRGDPATKVNVKIALKMLNTLKLQNEIMAVSSPRSSRYGQHLTKDELTELTSPDADMQNVVSSWLAGADLVSTVSPRGDRIELQATIAELEALFQTKVHEYSSDLPEFQNIAHKVIQADALYAPPDVAAVVSAVFGLHGTPLKVRKPLVTAPVSQMAKVTPAVLKQVYNVGGVIVSRGTKNKRATAEFQGQRTTQADLTAFFKEYVPDAKPGDEKYTCHNAGQCEPPTPRVQGQGAGTEAQLDIQYIAGVAPGIKNEVWSYMGMAWCTDLKQWTSDILDHNDPPQVFSVSYGIQGNVSLDKSQGCSKEVTMNIEDDFAKIAARGVTVMVSSGDDGSGGTILFHSKLWPSWPASAPHVTSVGATKFINDADITKGEKATTQFGSGGGFDCRWGVQDWQKDATSGYLANKGAKLPSEKDFCRAGRATPEISALGQGYQVINNGKTLNVGGTSASSPLFAGLVSLLNEYRIQNGKSPLGFINPLIYEIYEKKKASFQDVTVGNNRIGRGGATMPLSEGYSCTEGWDAVTGVGTPNFAEILEYVKTLPSGQRDVVV